MAHLYNYIYYLFSYTVAIAPFIFCYLCFIRNRKVCFMQEDTIVGIASGMGGGIGIIRISGDNSLSLVKDAGRSSL